MGYFSFATQAVTMLSTGMLGYLWCPTTDSTLLQGRLYVLAPDGRALAFASTDAAGVTTFSRVDLAAAVPHAKVLGQGEVEGAVATGQAFLWTAPGGLYSAAQR